MKYYIIRYKTTSAIKQISIIAASPEGAKAKFRESNPFAEIVSCRLR